MDSRLARNTRHKVYKKKEGKGKEGTWLRAVSEDMSLNFKMPDLSQHSKSLSSEEGR